MLKSFNSARLVSVPIVVVRTLDQIAAARDILQSEADHPVFQWDTIRGVRPLNKLAEKAQQEIGLDPDATLGFPEAMVAAQSLPTNAVLLALNAHLQLASAEPRDSATAIQAVANLRDQLKRNFRMLVLLASPGFAVPAEIEQDTVVLNHDLPGREALGAIVDEVYRSAKQAAPDLPALTKDIRLKAIEAVLGLSEFAAEQAIAMSLTEQGIDLDGLWDRKRTTIEQGGLLKVWRGKETFKDLRGLDGIVARLEAVKNGRKPLGVVVFLDEIDKVFANVESDTSGVRMDQFRTFLTEMEDNSWNGVVLMGVSGSGKSAIAKALGNEAGVLTIALDLGALEAKHVGESEANLRRVISIIKEVGGGNAFFIATSNNASVMRPEMQRRFRKGAYFFDVMSDEARAEAFKMYIKKYGLDAKQPLPKCDAWTGAEVRNCCEEAWELNQTLLEAAESIVPVALAKAKDTEELRQHAHNKYLDASKSGKYQYSGKAMEQMLRAIQLPTTKGKVN